MHKSEKIGLLPAIAVQTNAMIGAGVVATPAILAETASTLGLLSYIVAIFIALCMTFSLGELSLLHGGQAWCYRFPHIIGGHLLGMIASFCYLLGVLIAMGFVAKQAGIWLHESIPLLGPGLLSLLAMLLLSTLILAGKNLSSVGQFTISAVIFLGIITISAICLTNFNEEIFFAKSDKGIAPLLTVTPLLLFSFLGFECISSLYTIIKHPRKNVLRGGVIGVLLVGMLYLLFSGSILGAIPIANFTGGSSHSIANILMKTFPKYHFLSLLIYLGGLFAILGTLHSMVWSVSLLIVDVLKKSKNNVVHSLFDKKILNHKSSLFFTFLIIVLCCFFLTDEAILNSAVLLIVTSFLLSICALFKEKEHRLRNRLICLFGVAGAIIMILFSAYSLVSSLLP